MRLAQATQGLIQRNAEPIKRFGRITGVDATTGTCTVVIGGEPVPHVGWVSPYSPAVGDYVVIIAGVIMGRPSQQAAVGYEEVRRVYRPIRQIYASNILDTGDRYDSLGWDTWWQKPPGYEDTPGRQGNAFQGGSNDPAWDPGRTADATIFVYDIPTPPTGAIDVTYSIRAQRRDDGFEPMAPPQIYGHTYTATSPLPSPGQPPDLAGGPWVLQSLPRVPADLILRPGSEQRMALPTLTALAPEWLASGLSTGALTGVAIYTEQPERTGAFEIAIEISYLTPQEA